MLPPHNRNEAVVGKVMFGRSSRGHRVYGCPRPNPSGGGKAVTDLRLTDGGRDSPRPFRCSRTTALDGHRATFRRSCTWNYANGSG